jgi:ADP-heptose:LPS heptosyltransferase
MKRILVIMNRFIGDLLFMAPALYLIRDSYPDARLEILINKDCEGLIEPPLVDKVHAFDRTVRDLKGWRRASREIEFVSRFWRSRYDLVVDLSVHSRNFWIVSMIRSPRKLALGPIRRPWQRLAYTKIIPVVQVRYETGRFLKVPELGLGLDTREYQTRITIPVSEADKASAHRFLEETGVARPFILFAPFSRGMGKYRTWPFEKYRDVFEWANQNGMTPLVLSGSEDDRWIKELRDACTDRFKLVTGQTLGCVKGLMRLAETIVSIDTGIIHMAAGVGLRGVCLWGPTNYGGKTPVSNCHIHLEKSYECRKGCHKPIWDKCKDRKCMEDITPAEVIAAIDSLRAENTK